MSELACFAFNTHAVRAVNRDGDPWFVAGDVASVLGFQHVPHMVRMLGDDEKDVHNVDSRSENGVIQSREVTIISESGLYACVLKSRRKEAQSFRKWVTAEVLPSIRKTGSYARADVPPPYPGIPAHCADLTVAAARTFNAMMRAARTMNLPLPRAAAEANAVARRKTGVDVMGELGVLPQELYKRLNGAEDDDDEVTAMLRTWLEEGAGPGPWSMAQIVAEVFEFDPAGRKGLATAMKAGKALRRLGIRQRVVEDRETGRQRRMWERAPA